MLLPVCLLHLRLQFRSGFLQNLLYDTYDLLHMQEMVQTAADRKYYHVRPRRSDGNAPLLFLSARGLTVPDHKMHTYPDFRMQGIRRTDSDIRPESVLLPCIHFLPYGSHHRN